MFVGDETLSYNKTSQLYVLKTGIKELPCWYSRLYYNNDKWQINILAYEEASADRLATHL